MAFLNPLESPKRFYTPLATLEKSLNTFAKGFNEKL
jgi:hypothetical protein